METNNNNNNAASQSFVGALARRNNLSVDAFLEISETRIGVYNNFTSKLNENVKSNCEIFELKVGNHLRAVRENANSIKSAQADKFKIENKIEELKNKLRSAEKRGVFIKIIKKDSSFRVLSFATILFLGFWSFVVYYLIRTRKIDTTDIIGSLVDYFSKTPISVGLIAGVLGFGIIFYLFFISIYLVMYKNNHLINASPKWQSIETWSFRGLLSFEIYMTIYSLYQSKLAGLTNKHLYEATWISLLLESTLFLAIWFLYYFFIFKPNIFTIRERAGKASTEIYLMEMRDNFNKLKDQNYKLEEGLKNLKLTKKALEENKKTLRSNIQEFKTTKYDILQQADNEKNIVKDFGQKWLQVALDEFTLGDITKIQGYETAIKDIVKDIIKNIDILADRCVKFVENYKHKIQLLLKQLNGETINLSPIVSKLLPIIVVFLSLTLSSCGNNTNLKRESIPKATNLIIGSDLSNRFLKDNDSLFIPVKFDQKIIKTAYGIWEKDINNTYEKGLDVKQVNGAFSVIPIPLPNDPRNGVSALGFTFDLNELPEIKRWIYLKAKKDSILKVSKMMYQKALSLRPEGADIWAFFRDLPQYLKPSKDSLWDNKLILLTDGYPYIENNLKIMRTSVGYRRDYLDEKDMLMLRKSKDWKKTFKKYNMGFIPIGKKYTNLDILIIGLNEPKNLKGSAKELSIIQRYWSDFFESMGVKNYAFVKFNSPAALNILHNFINSK